jgi:hypothetical protein
MIVEEDSNNEIKISQSFRYISNNGPVNVFERPTEIDNSDIEGEHPGQLKPNLIVSFLVIAVCSSIVTS